MPDLACAAAAARTTPLAPIRPAISISTRVIRLLTTPILGSEVPGDFSRVNPLALLRRRRERPRRSRTADKRDELPSPHGAFPTAKDHGLSIAGQDRASQQKRPAHVRFGSTATEAIDGRDFECPLQCDTQSRLACCAARQC